MDQHLIREIITLLESYNDEVEINKEAIIALLNVTTFGSLDQIVNLDLLDGIIPVLLISRHIKIITHALSALENVSFLYFIFFSFLFN